MANADNRGWTFMGLGFVARTRLPAPAHAARAAQVPRVGVERGTDQSTDGTAMNDEDEARAELRDDRQRSRRARQLAHHRRDGRAHRVAARLAETLARRTAARGTSCDPWYHGSQLVRSRDGAEACGEPAAPFRPLGETYGRVPAPHLPDACCRVEEPHR